jgi:hypothetical protein
MKGVLGELTHAPQLLEVATLSYCSGLIGVGVHGTAALVKPQLIVDTWHCVSGPGATAALGMRVHAGRQQEGAVWTF